VKKVGGPDTRREMGGAKKKFLLKKEREERETSSSSPSQQQKKGEIGDTRITSFAQKGRGGGGRKKDPFF